MSVARTKGACKWSNKGDGELDSDSDSGGTGERGGVERGESLPAGWDISADHIQNASDAQDDEDPSS